MIAARNIMMVVMIFFGCEGAPTLANSGPRHSRLNIQPWATGPLTAHKRNRPRTELLRGWCVFVFGINGLKSPSLAGRFQAPGGDDGKAL